MKEKYLNEAFKEYAKRLAPYCKLELVELFEYKLPKDPSKAEIDQALKKEAADIAKYIPQNAFVIALCIEGVRVSSQDFADFFQKCANEGKSKICFIIGSSFGLDESVKCQAQLLLSMSDMTFTRSLARIILTEQIYRALTINFGGKYDK